MLSTETAMYKTSSFIYKRMPLYLIQKKCLTKLMHSLINESLKNDNAAVIGTKKYRAEHFYYILTN